MLVVVVLLDEYRRICVPPFLVREGRPNEGRRNGREPPILVLVLLDQIPPTSRRIQAVAARPAVIETRGGTVVAISRVKVDLIELVVRENVFVRVRGAEAPRTGVNVGV